MENELAEHFDRLSYSQKNNFIRWLALEVRVLKIEITGY